MQPHPARRPEPVAGKGRSPVGGTGKPTAGPLGDQLPWQAGQVSQKVLERPPPAFFSQLGSRRPEFSLREFLKSSDEK